jgi:hypothetical protein
MNIHVASFTCKLVHWTEEASKSIDCCHTITISMCNMYIQIHSLLLLHYVKIPFVMNGTLISKNGIIVFHPLISCLSLILFLILIPFESKQNSQSLSTSMQVIYIFISARKGVVYIIWNYTIQLHSLPWSCFLIFKKVFSSEP